MYLATGICKIAFVNRLRVAANPTVAIVAPAICLVTKIAKIGPISPKAEKNIISPKTRTLMTLLITGPNILLVFILTYQCRILKIGGSALGITSFSLAAFVH